MEKINIEDGANDLKMNKSQKRCTTHFLENCVDTAQKNRLKKPTNTLHPLIFTQMNRLTVLKISLWYLNLPESSILTNIKQVIYDLIIKMFYYWEYNRKLPEFRSVSNTRRINVTPLRVKTAIAGLGDKVTVFSNIPRWPTTPEEWLCVTRFTFTVSIGSIVTNSMDACTSWEEIKPTQKLIE